MGIYRHTDRLQGAASFPKVMPRVHFSKKQDFRCPFPRALRRKQSPASTAKPATLQLRARNPTPTSRGWCKKPAGGNPSPSKVALRSLGVPGSRGHGHSSHRSQSPPTAGVRCRRQPLLHRILVRPGQSCASLQRLETLVSLNVCPRQMFALQLLQILVSILNPRNAFYCSLRGGFQVLCCSGDALALLY